MNTRSFSLSALLAAVAGAFLIGIALGRSPIIDKKPASSPSSLSSDLPRTINTSLVQEVWNILHEKYAGKVDDEKLARGILHGLVQGLGDPYSAYADPKETAQFEDDLSGSFTGIGVEIGVRRNLVTVIAPLKDSPAEKAGIRAADIIVGIDDLELTTETSLTDVVSRIRGPAGTPVTLKIVREGDTEPRSFTVTRARIDVPSLESRREGTIGIIQVFAFREDTGRRFSQAVRNLLQAGVSGIVLDLRNNPGGILDGAVDIAGHFVERGTVVVREVPADPKDTVEHRSRGPADLAKLPVVVIVNEGSASASEILAGALRDLRKIPVMGAETFGKGTVQELIDLSDGSSVRVTIAKWLTPSGKEFTGHGLTPDIEVKDETPDNDTDDVLERAIQELRKQTGS